MHRNREIYLKYLHRFQHGKKPITMQDLANMYGITKARVSQIIIREIKKEEPNGIHLPKDGNNL